MIRRPPRSTRTDTLFPYTTLFRSRHRARARPAQSRFWRRAGVSDDFALGHERPAHDRRLSPFGLAPHALGHAVHYPGFNRVGPRGRAPAARTGGKDSGESHTGTHTECVGDRFHGEPAARGHRVEAEFTDAGKIGRAHV